MVAATGSLIITDIFPLNKTFGLLQIIIKFTLSKLSPYNSCLYPQSLSDTNTVKTTAEPLQVDDIHHGGGSHTRPKLQ